MVQKKSYAGALYWVLFLVLFLSGFAGLGYEMVWTRMLSVGLGHEIISILAVMAALFCGLAAGSWLLEGFIRRSSAPGRCYAVLEMIVGLWSVVLIGCIPWFNRIAPRLMGVEPSAIQHWAVSFLFPLLLLFPATFAMGATLPAMEQVFSRLLGRHRSVGELYAANTLGAVAGTLTATFWIVPKFGFQTTLSLLAAVNMLCAAGVLFGTAGRKSNPASAGAADDRPPPAFRLLLSLFFTGLLGIGYEVVVVRVVSQVLESTVFSFASVLSVYLFGTALGAALIQSRGTRRDFAQDLTYLLGITSAACSLGIVLLRYSEAIYGSVRAFTGGGFAGSILAEIVLGATVFLLPTMAMGATFSHLAQAARSRKWGLGRALCSNTLGAACAPLLFGVVLLPRLGSKGSLLLVAASYLLLVPKIRLSGVLPVALPAAFAMLLFLSSNTLMIVSLGPGERVVDHTEGIMAAVAVVKDVRDEFHLKVDNKFQMGGTSSYYSDRRQGHIPLLLHPDPKRVLYLGLGTGATFAAAADHPGLEADGVELVPEILPLIHHFEKSTGDFSRYEHLHLKIADARRYVSARGQNYDVVVADLFHPARDGAGSLYTVEHFDSIRSILNPGGLFCQWLPLYQLDLPTLRVIIRTFLHVFPDGCAYLAHYSLRTPILALVSGTGPADRYPYDWFSSRVRDATLSRELRALRLEDLYSLLGCFAASNTDLSAFAGPGPLNTDDRPIVTFQAPYFAYSTAELPHQRLFAILDAFHPQPEQILKPASTEEEQRIGRHLSAYWTARDRFLHAGVGVPETADVMQLVKHTRESLLSIVRTSPDFSAAYNPLLAMARGLYKIDRDASKSLLLDLEQANPAREDARKIRQHLFSE